MKAVMFTNTFRPHVGGVSTSVDTLAAALKRNGHEVFVVAPQVRGSPSRESGVIRVPAVASPFSGGFHIPLGFAAGLNEIISDFGPDIVHAHHPFLLGDTALRVAASLDIPTVFTYHTRYEHYTHYVGANMASVRRAVLTLSCGYCNLCDWVIAPSESLREHLLENGVVAPIRVIPTGIDAPFFAQGNGSQAREWLGIPDDAFVIGHVGRLVPEKNLDYLAAAVAKFLERAPHAHAIFGGSGSMADTIRQYFENKEIGTRIHFTGNVTGSKLADIYCALNVFAFSSLTETQGLVLLEAMAAGVPVVALDAPGVREVIRDGYNGRLLAGLSGVHAFAAALNCYLEMDPDLYSRQRKAAHRTALDNSVERYRTRVLDLYEDAISARRPAKPELSRQSSARRRLFRRELDIIKNAAKAVALAFGESPS